MAASGRTVVITGVGALTPLGLGAHVLFEGLLAGKSGVRRIERFDTTQHATHFAAEVRGCVYQPEAHYTKQESRRMDPFTQIGVVAAREAWKDAGLDGSYAHPERGGAIMGTGIGGITSILEQNEILRESGPIYNIRYDKVPLDVVANSERNFPSNWIAANRTDVTDDFIAYARPLVGEDWVSVPLVAGRQRFARIQPTFVEKKLAAYVPQAYR